ncbi:MAG: thymidylate synthase, partial [Syntrophomonas sp.]|uniref:thymidylate synthase n=1 Tax=Syntrophomonas sp. TaxID=2053627 RepID=UPI0026311E05
MSKADNVFIAMCKDILDNGISSKGEIVRAKWSDGIPAHTIKKFGVINRYDLSEEFPILTLRPINLKAAIDELLWIWQKKSNNIKELNSSIWDSWANKDGSIGKAYGYQLSIKHKYGEGEFDQVDRVLYDLKNNPYSRRIIVNMYNHNDL